MRAHRGHAAEKIKADMPLFPPRRVYETAGKNVLGKPLFIGKLGCTAKV